MHGDATAGSTTVGTTHGNSEQTANHACKHWLNLGSRRILISSGFSTYSTATTLDIALAAAAAAEPCSDGEGEGLSSRFPDGRHQKLATEKRSLKIEKEGTRKEEEEERCECVSLFQ
jgi:hypothetical protein